MKTETILSELAIRPITEFGLLLSDPIFWGAGARNGDGHPVLVLPGLYAGDAYLRPLRSWLRRIGYTPMRSGLERNPGWSEELVHKLSELTEAVLNRTRRRVTIIGHSMGGVLARSIAVRRPYAVRQVITIGSPLMMRRERLPETVDMVAIYSRDDLVVRYPNALASERHALNLEVHGSHVGLMTNPEVYRQLNRLVSSR
jgi:pimeloyl-ACP methyl ester carboxylesterase